MHEVILSRINASEMRDQAAELSAIHQAAFGEDPARAKRYRAVSIPEMSRHSGLHAMTARSAGHLVGFVLGYDAIADPGWFANVSRAIRGHDIAAQFPAAWYLADIAVHPDVRGMGIGTSLLNGIMRLVADRQSVLITWHGDHPAKRLYARLGWCESVPDLEYRPGGPLTSLMEHPGQDSIS